ncbi:MAG: hypothetical protein JSV03_07805 [Planctomycetota bacterium]|nr:MAG: hypothetical protein JSV03_07805 [Planctomycetota bacterium]
MIFKSIKLGLLAVGGLAVVGGLVFGTELVSYVTSSTKLVRTKVRDAVPIEFELRRARDLLEDIIPEIQTNVRLIAQEEVEINRLKADINQSRDSLNDEQARIVKFREALNTQRANYTFGGYDYTRPQVKGELARRFDRFKEANIVFAAKQRLLSTREKSLQAAMQMLERTRSQKSQLENRIAALESQYRLVKAASANSKIQLDNSKLAQTEKLIDDIKKRLDVAERVLAHEANFVQPISVDVIDEKDLLVEVDQYLDKDRESPTQASEEALALNRTEPNK